MLSSLKNLTNSSAIKSAYTINEEGGFRAGAWLVQELHALGVFVVAFQRILGAGEGVVADQGD